MAAAYVKLTHFGTGTGLGDPKQTSKPASLHSSRIKKSTKPARMNKSPDSFTSPPQCRAMALPRYPNHNTPYDPWEDPELDMPYEKMLKKGDPGTFQAVIKGAMPVGYWVIMPSGKEAYLPAQDIGFLGGLERLRKIFRPGDEVTVRVVTRGSSGREVLSLKVPDPNKPDPPPKPLRKDFLPGGSLAARRRRYQQQQ